MVCCDGWPANRLMLMVFSQCNEVKVWSCRYVHGHHATPCHPSIEKENMIMMDVPIIVVLYAGCFFVLCSLTFIINLFSLISGYLECGGTVAAGMEWGSGTRVYIYNHFPIKNKIIIDFILSHFCIESRLHSSIKSLFKSCVLNYSALLERYIFWGR